MSCTWTTCLLWSGCSRGTLSFKTSVGSVGLQTAAMLAWLTMQCGLLRERSLTACPILKQI